MVGTGRTTRRITLPRNRHRLSRSGFVSTPEVLTLSAEKESTFINAKNVEATRSLSISRPTMQVIAARN